MSNPHRPDRNLALDLVRVTEAAAIAARSDSTGAGAAAANGYLAHREQRLDQIRDVVRARGPQVTAAEVVAVVYADVPSEVREAAAWSVAAQLAYLEEQGER